MHKSNAAQKPNWQKVAKAKVYITLNKAHNGNGIGKGKGNGKGDW